MNPKSYDSQHIRIVASFSELVDKDFEAKINACCWYRNLEGDFKELVNKLQLKQNITQVTPQQLEALQLSEQGAIAREIILKDIQLLTDFGAAPTLNLLKCYERDDAFTFIATDVYSFHVDRSPIATDTFLCTYHGAPSDIIANEHAVQKVLIPEIRTQLKKLHNGPVDEFDTFLQEHYFDLHYQPLPHATATSLGIGHLWRLAVEHPTQHVPPCIHRAPIENDGEYRLLLIC
ncbi:MAG: DUF1826 domain-containing protein [Flavobacterium sp.]